MQFPDRKEGIFRPGKEIKGLRGGILTYVAQASPQIDTARAEKHPSRMETIYLVRITWAEQLFHQESYCLTRFAFVVT